MANLFFASKALTDARKEYEASNTELVVNIKPEDLLRLVEPIPLKPNKLKRLAKAFKYEIPLASLPALWLKESAYGYKVYRCEGFHRIAFAYQCNCLTIPVILKHDSIKDLFTTGTLNLESLSGPDVSVNAPLYI